MKPITTAGQKRVRGKRKHYVALYTWINSAQDQQLNEIIKITGKEKKLLVAEALQLLIAMYHQAGAI